SESALTSRRDAAARSAERRSRSARCLRPSRLRELHASAARRSSLVQRDDGLLQRRLDRGAGALPVADDRIRALRDLVAEPVVAVAAGRRRALLHGDELVRLVVRPARPHSIETTRISNFKLLPASG